MPTATINYSSNTVITMNLANLASDTTFLAGRESNQIDNTTTKYIDCLVSGFVSVGTSPTSDRTINVYVWGADTSLATTPINSGSSTGGLDGTDSNETLSNTGILNALRFGAAVSVPATTSDLQYAVLPFSVASLFGGAMPKYWGLFVSHNTVANLRNTAVNTDSFEFVGIKYDVA